jgi:hypothetical protein
VTPKTRIRLIEAMADVMPHQAVTADCSECHPEGGCPNPRGCVGEFCERLVDLVEREMETGQFAVRTQ